MTLVLKSTWWDNLAAQFGFTNDGSTTIDSDVLLETLEDFVVLNLSQLTSTTFLAGFASVVQPSASKKNESSSLVPVNVAGDVVLGFGGYDYLAGTSSDNILHGGVGNDFFNPGAGIDFVVGGDYGTPAYERDTVGYMLATSGIVVEMTDGGIPPVTGLLPNQDVYSFSYADWVDPAIIKISEFEVGPNGDIVDVSALLTAVGYTGSNAVADGYIKFSTSSDGLKIQFDPDGNAGSQSGKELVRILDQTISTFSVTDNLRTVPFPPVTGDENFLTYVSNDGFGSYDILYSVENIIGSNHDDVIHGHTVLANVLIGGAGNDSLYGEGGYDKLVGGEGLDNVYGGDGLDTLIIGKGGDNAYGGNDADLFKFDITIGTNISANTAHIWDFQVGAGGDKIDVSEILSAAGYAGNDAIADGYVQIVQSGSDTHVNIDIDGAGVLTAQTLAVLHGIQANQVSVTDNLQTDAPTTLFVSILGQSNAEGLRVFGEDSESAVTRIKGGLDAGTDYDNISMTFRDEYGTIVMPAIGSTRVNGDYGGKASDSWWFPSTNQPGEILIRTVQMMAVQLAAARAAGVVKPIVIWGQGEGDCVFIGGQTTEAARLAAQEVYKNATLSVFDYIKSQLGSDIEFYVMETGRYIQQAALNAGVSQATIDRTMTGLPYIRAAQEDMALDRTDVHLAVKYTDLPMNYEVDPLATTDYWHFHPETREIIGDRVADFIMLEQGYDHVLDNPGDYPLYMLDDLQLKNVAGMTVNGNGNNNIVVGTLGNDILTGGLGNDALYGGAGTDEAHYQGIYADYTLTQGTYLTVVDNVWSDGTDTLIQVERAVFSDGIYENGVFTPFGGNNAPIAQDDVFVGVEDTNITGNLLVDNGNGPDTDPDSDPLSVVPGTFATANGSVTILANGDFTYTPNAGYFGPDTFNYTLQDGRGGGDLGTVNLTVNQAPNGPPVAQDDVFSGNQDTLLTGNLLANNGNGPDTDPDNDPLSVTPATFTTSHGQVVIFANGDFTYMPSAGYFGPEMFFYTVLDGQGHSDTGRVDITINQVLPNDPPVAQDDAFTGNQNTNILGNLLVNNGNGPDSDPDSDPLSVTPGTFATANGSVTILANGDFTYTPNAGYFGTDTFDYTLLDGRGGDDIGTVNLTINEVLNNEPIAQDDAFTGSLNTNVTGNLLVNNGNGPDTDPDSDPLSVTPGTFATANGSVTILANGDFTYTPNAGYFGTDTFDYTLLDGRGGDDIGTVNLTITNEDDTFTATAPAENFNGGAGNDTVTYINSTAAVVIDLLNNTSTGGFAAGDTFVSIENLIGSNLVALKDTLKGNDGVNSLYGLVGDDNLYGNGGDDNLYGGDGLDILSGDNGNDNLYGDAGNDTLKGRDGDDSLYGGEGNDYLEGGNNNDTLYGGAGADTLKGSAGVDTFVFQSMADAGDTIQDFNRTAGEKVDISDILSGIYDPLTEAITDFVQIVDSGLNSVLSIDITGTATNFVQVATILNVTGLTDEQALVNNGTLIVV
ncbi:MAG: tandem-95 repeat protein [Alphaproteobacteria bacterium]|nr:tandem-95 repeat protein [Alphaproteobacteria bacterium]QQS57098.1 MAG: tandem-95 repeat protein [Alphaproteobacteria bacterium]